MTLRLPLFGALSALLLLLAQPAAAQPTTGQDDRDGCTSREPCPWVLEVTADGFRQRMANGTFVPLNYETEFTLGEWVEISLFSSDPNATHTVRLDGHDVSVRVGPDGYTTDTGAFQFRTVGSFMLRDQPSGDTLEIHVVPPQDDDAAGTVAPGDEEGAPLPGLLLSVVALALAGVLRRRGPHA